MSNLDQNQQNETNHTPIVLDQNLKPIQENEISEDTTKLLDNATDKVKDAIKRVQGIEVTDSGIVIANPIADFQRIYGIAMEVASTATGSDKLYAHFNKPETYIRNAVEGALDKLQDEGVGVLSTPQMSGLILLPSKTKFVPKMISGLKQIRYYPNSNMRSIVYVPYVIRKDGDTIERIPFTYGDNKVISFLDFNYSYNVGNVFLDYYRGKDFNPVIENNFSVAVLSVDINKCFEENMNSVVIVPEINSALIDIETLKSTMPDILTPFLIGELMYPIGEVTVEKEFECEGNKFSLAKQYGVRPNEIIYYVKVEDSSSVVTLLTENQESLEATLNEISNYIHDNFSPNKESMKPFVIPGLHKGRGATDKDDVYLCFIQHHVNDQTKFKSELPSDVVYEILLNASVYYDRGSDDTATDETPNSVKLLSLKTIIERISNIKNPSYILGSWLKNYVNGENAYNKLFDSPTGALNKINLALYLTEMFNNKMFFSKQWYKPYAISPSKLLGSKLEENSDNDVSDILFSSLKFFSDATEITCAEMYNSLDITMLTKNFEMVKEENIIPKNEIDNLNFLGSSYGRFFNFSYVRLFSMPNGDKVLASLVLVNEEEVEEFKNDNLSIGKNNWYIIEKEEDIDSEFINNSFVEITLDKNDDFKVGIFDYEMYNLSISSETENHDVFVAEDGRHYIGLITIPKPVII